MIIKNSVNINNIYGIDAKTDILLIRGSSNVIISFDLDTDIVDGDEDADVEGIAVPQNTILIPARSIDVDNAYLTLQFVASYGSTRPGLTRYTIGTEYMINYELGSQIPQLYNFSLNTNNDRGGSSLEWSLTELGTTPYSVTRSSRTHPLGPSFGSRLDAYGLPFDTAKYDLMIRLADGSLIRPIYGDINIFNRYAGKSTDYPPNS